MTGLKIYFYHAKNSRLTETGDWPFLLEFRQNFRSCQNFRILPKIRMLMFRMRNECKRANECNGWKRRPNKNCWRTSCWPWWVALDCCFGRVIMISMKSMLSMNLINIKMIMVWSSFLVSQRRLRFAECPNVRKSENQKVRKPECQIVRISESQKVRRLASLVRWSWYKYEKRDKYDHDYH